MARELNFSTGVETYVINGSCEVRFNPSDNAFVARLHNVMDKLAKSQEEGERVFAEADTDGAKVFELARQRDKEMRADIDGIFGEPVCDKIFGRMNVYALAGGIPLWANFLLALCDEVENAVGGSGADDTLNKYKAKYAKYVKK